MFWLTFIGISPFKSKLTKLRKEAYTYNVIKNGKNIRKFTEKFTEKCHTVLKNGHLKM